MLKNNYKYSYKYIKIIFQKVYELLVWRNVDACRFPTFQYMCFSWILNYIDFLVPI